MSTKAGDKMTPVEIILRTLDERGITRNKILTDLGLAKNSFNNWLSRGTSPTIDVMQKIADYLGVPINYFISYPSNAEPADRKARTPVQFWGKVSAGIGAYAEGMPIRAMAADDEDMISGYEYAWLEVEGDSMEDDLRDGDYVLVRVQDTAESGDLVVALIDDGCETTGVVKRLEVVPESHLALISSNPKYPPRIFVGDAMANVRIFGVVVTSKRRW